MAFCGSCGTPLADGAAFCGSCGAAAGTTTATTADATAVTGVDAAAVTAATAATPPVAEAATMPLQPPMQGLSPSGAGQPPVGGPGGPGGPGGYGPGGYVPPGPFAPGPGGPARRSWLWPVILVAIVAAVMAAVGIAYMATRDDDDGTATSGASPSGATATATATTTSTASPTPTADGLAGEAATATAPVSDAQAAANDAVAGIEATESSLADVQAAGEDLAETITVAESAIGGLTAATTQDADLQEAILEALAAQGDYAEALAALPSDPDQLTKAMAKDAAAAGQLATDAWEDAAGVGGEATAAFFQSITPPERFDKVQTLAKKIAKDRAMQAYLVKVGDLMEQSGEGREDVVTAINGVRGMTLNPKQAGRLIDAVYENRRAVLKKVKRLHPPADPQARKIKTHFADALQYSLKADTAFAWWILYVNDYYYQPPQGYQGNVPLNADYRAGVTWSGKASASKAALVKVYNKLAKKYGMKGNWKATEI